MPTKDLPLLNARLLYEKIEKAINRWPKGSPKGGQFAPAGAGDATTGDLFGGSKVGMHGVLPHGAAYHAQKDDHGNSVVVHAPTPASAKSTWHDAGKTATFTPGGKAPDTLNGTKLSSWHDAPTNHASWAKVEGTNEQLEHDSPFLPHPTKYTAAGVIIHEPDGRVWLTKPTNHYGGYQHTFPKGTAEPGLTLQQNAIKEAYEETGLKVKITGVLGDYDRDTSRARIYTAERVGGTPADMGWETQAMRLVPASQLHDYLNRNVDKGIASDFLWEHAQPVAKGFNASQPRWPKGSPLGGKWKSAGADGFTEPPKIGSATNPKYQKLAEGMHKAAQAGDWKHVQSAVEQLGEKVATHGSKAQLNSHDKWAAQAHQYGQQLLAEKEAQTKATASAHAIAGPAKLSDWSKVGDKPGGSSAGAVYKDQHGQKWLVKSYGDDDMAKSEVLASKLLQATGAHTADMQLVDLGGAHKGGLGVASKWVDGAEKLNAGNAQHVALAQKDFAAHAWLANWDSIGLAHDNTVIHGGHALHIDPGGALEYRAMGGKKGAAFGNTVGELDTLRDASKNAAAASVYGSMTHSQIVESAKPVLSLDHATISKLVKTYGPGDDTHKAALTAKLLARQQDLKQKLGAPENPHPAPAPASTHHSSDIETPSPVKPKISGTVYASVADEIEAAHKAGDVDAVHHALKDVPTNTTKGKQVHAYGAAAIAHLEGQNPPQAAAGKPSLTPPDIDKSTWGTYLNMVQQWHAEGDAASIANLHESFAASKSGAAGQLKSYLSNLHEDLTGKPIGAAAPAAKPAEEPAKPAREPKAAAEPPHVEAATTHAAAAKTPLALPAKPEKLSSAANPNVSLIKNVDAMHAHAQAYAAGSIDKDVALAAIASHSFGSNSFGKKASKYQADLLAALGSSKPAEVAPQVKAQAEKPAAAAAKPAKSAPKFDASKLSEPPNFLSWGNTGKGGPSSNDAVNHANHYATQAIHEAAKTGKPEAIDALKLPLVNKSTGAKSEVSPMNHPSQWVKSYAQQMKNELDSQLNPPKQFRLSGDNPIHSLHDAHPALASKQLGSHAEKIGGLVVLGHPGHFDTATLGLPHLTMENGGVTLQTYAKDAQAAFSKMPSAQQEAVQWYTSSGYKDMNKSLWAGNPDGQAKAVGEALHTLGHEIKAGTVLSRKVKSKDVGALLKATGKVVQEPGIMSTSIKPTAWSGDIQLKMTVGPGVKGLYVDQGSKPGGGAISHNAGDNEREIMLPPNTRFLVQKVEVAPKGGDKDGFGQHEVQHIVHVLVLPSDSGSSSGKKGKK